MVTTRTGTYIIHREMSLSCATQEYDKVKTPYYAIFPLLSVKRSFTGG